MSLLGKVPEQNIKNGNCEKINKSYHGSSVAELVLQRDAAGTVGEI